MDMVANAFCPAFSPWGEGARRADEGFPVMQEKSKAWIRKSGATALARHLRKTETEAEARLWSTLRNRRLNGHKFVRQVALGSYVVDFLHREKNLVVELDGSQHAESTKDAIRTDWLNAQGYSVLRFWNNAIFADKDGVTETILAVIDGRISQRCEITRFYPSTKRHEDKG